MTGGRDVSIPSNVLHQVCLAEYEVQKDVEVVGLADVVSSESLRSIAWM